MNQQRDDIKRGYKETTGKDQSERNKSNII